ncbi:DNA repair protein RadA (plasmid) [Alteromonas mediterranea]|uniref:DNA repair protein RadA n=1 Tax=Alteromonas mediterranea TaxID=314275 RepID=A0AAC9NU89_9ALTE|nr:DNA repair protein RadA [Alteromonas mediterranea]APD92327.1 DNA repair protein RadA [Alteromonas mediterranea]APE00188.1 DNA repair protein RadA [Alteromonas mediterranea]
MAKAKTEYECTNCHEKYPRWLGQCSECKEWNTIEECKASDVDAMANRGKGRSNERVGYSGQKSSSTPRKMSDIENSSKRKLKTGIKELDRAMDDGFAVGSVTYLSGDPGAGKTTLCSTLLAKQSNNYKTLYATGEESETQFKLRNERMGLKYDDDNFLLLCTVNVFDIIAEIERVKPQWVCVDSLQAIYNPELDSAIGGPSQQVECATLITHAAKKHGAITLVIGQVTKDDKAAGPRRVEHIMDGRIHLEVNDGELRTLRPHKNRYGSTETIGLFKMTSKGLVSIDNPSKLFLSGSKEGHIGAAVTCIRDGSRTLLLEVQSLVDDCEGDYVERNTIGISRNRMKMIMAVMNKYGRVKMSAQNVYASLVGGLKLQESDSSADLAVAASLYSSLNNFVIPTHFCFLGEIALSGEIRQIPNGVPRVIEAATHGFTTIVLPERNYHPSMEEKTEDNTTILRVKNINDLFSLLKRLME